MKQIMMLMVAMFFAANAWAADAMQEGKQLLQSQCLSCHNAELDPPMGPPMFAVQKRYKLATADRNDFIEQVTAFTVHPSEERVVMTRAVEQLGLMPDIGAKEAEVRKIAAYIHDETFAPPCAHWQIGMKIVKAEGDKQHFKKDQMMYDRFCVNKPVTASAPVAEEPASDGSLKKIMQQLGRDYSSLNHSILLKDFGGAARAAHAIADHDKPSMGQRLKLMSELGTEMSDFKKADGKVHDLAIKIEAAARARDMPLLIQTQSQMLSACMACHTSYRSRIVNLLK